MRVPPSATDHFIVGTAGHIDHGKTSLVCALTGTNCDRLPEEKARGITIALGFAHLQLDNRRISFVDVPGHERLVRTMIAGASGLDAAMLCVSAVEGVMPQTVEHLQVLQLLGVKHGLVVLTMTDLLGEGDEAEEMLELAMMDIADGVQGTFLEGAPVVATSAASPESAHGLEALTAALLGLPKLERSNTGPFRLPIDRAFIRHGFGTVVTGTVRSGTLQDGENVVVLPAGIDTRVRGIQVHGEESADTRAGLRTAINLAGVERDDLARGMVVVRRGEVESTSILDARIRLLPNAAPLIDGGRVRLLVGTAEVLAVVSVLSGEEPTHNAKAQVQPGGTGLVQFRTEKPLVALNGDRLILRRESPLETLGGGLILDAWARRVRKRDRLRAVAELGSLEEGDESVLFLRAGDLGLSQQEAALRGLVDGQRVGDRLLHSSIVKDQEDALLAELEAWHVAHPLAAGIAKRAMHGGRRSHWGQRQYDGLVGRLAEPNAEGVQRVILDGPLMRLASFTLEINAELKGTLVSIEQDVGGTGLEGVPFATHAATGGDAIQYLLREKRLARVGDRLVSSEHLQQMVKGVTALIQKNGAMEPSDFKGLTGLSRRYAIPLMEWLDAEGVTQRSGDKRTLRHGGAV